MEGKYKFQKLQADGLDYIETYDYAVATQTNKEFDGEQYWVNELNGQVDMNLELQKGQYILTSQFKEKETIVIEKGTYRTQGDSITFIPENIYTSDKELKDMFKEFEKYSETFGKISRKNYRLGKGVNGEDFFLQVTRSEHRCLFQYENGMIKFDNSSFAYFFPRNDFFYKEEKYRSSLFLIRQ